MFELRSLQIMIVRQSCVIVWVDHHCLSMKSRSSGLILLSLTLPKPDILLESHSGSVDRFG